MTLAILRGGVTIAGQYVFPLAKASKASVRRGKVGVRRLIIQFPRKNMAKKLYVGGLPYSTTDEQLREAFSESGEVSSATVIMDKMTGRSKGFGFVEFANDAEADAAINRWNGADFGGRSLTVNEARPLEARPPRQNGGGYGNNDRGGYGGGNRW